MAERASEEQQRFSAEELRAAPRMVGARSEHEVAGALAGNRKRSFTVEEARRAVESFRKHRDETERA